MLAYTVGSGIVPVGEIEGTAKIAGSAFESVRCQVIGVGFDGLAADKERVMAIVDERNRCAFAGEMLA